MRKLLGRAALLLGVLLVGGAAWWGAVTLFDDGASDESTDQPACTPATKPEARAAQSAFVREYARKRWVSGYGVREVDGGSILFVITTRAAPDGLPECLRGVPVSYSRTGPFHAD